MAKKKPAPKKPALTRGQAIGQSLAGSALLLGWSMFLWQMSELLQHHTEWAEMKTPPGVAEILKASFYATVAFGGAFFSNFSKMAQIFKGVVK